MFTGPYAKQGAWIQSIYSSSPFSNISFNIIIPHTPKSSKWSYFLRFSTKTLHARFFDFMHSISPATSSSWFDHFNIIWWRVQVMKLLIVIPIYLNFKGLVSYLYAAIIFPCILVIRYHHKDKVPSISVILLFFDIHNGIL